VGKVYSLAEAIDDPQIAQRGMVVEVEAPGVPGGKVSQVGIPMRLSDTPGKVRHVGAVAGEHTSQMLEGLGYTPEHVEDMRRRQVVE
jgi:crotonobetainyl-CoA:carnitine CoA-transferase CaiB-like acyl-CoA transferase